ncbi:Chlororespiratory reduction 42 [Melia azedarach]|uniref:Chlororespiratory reduction 42 n=1 Tax=Melia azedarach TaxID=155640 RepID=A0ACC1YMN1_MELAZ|nr:Chlororespiratory reduction 42 [Melia azedarach]
MALNLNLSSSIACSKLQYNSNQQFKPKFLIKCEAKDSSSSSSSGKSSKEELKSKLEIGSPVIVIEAPKMIKTAATVPCLRVNSGLVNPGDVGRIVSRKPKDVWAVRLSIGTYLIDGKYFKPLELQD